jgi:sialidase-1
MEKRDVYLSGENGCKSYRLPTCIVTRDGTILVFCDGRKTSAADHGQINPVVRRSVDGGRTWGAITVLAGEPDEVAKIGNGSAFYDRQADTVHFIYLKNLTQAFLVSSTDGGATFSQPREITEVFKEFKFPWKYFATGHVHGIQMSSGRLVIPIWLSDCPRMAEEAAIFTAGIIYSDDHAKTFKAGGLASTNKFKRLNEGSVFQRADGSLCYNLREMSRGYRVTATSTDGGLTWSQPEPERQLYDPTCQASTLVLPSKDGKCRVLFCNPAGRQDRTQLTVRLSEDGGQTWPIARVVDSGPAAYSDLAVADDGTLLAVYETGEKRPYKKVGMARFNLEWLKQDVTGTAGTPPAPPDPPATR